MAYCSMSNHCEEKLCQFPRPRDIKIWYEYFTRQLEKFLLNYSVESEGDVNMTDTTIQVLDKGPFIVNGNVKIIDADGNPFKTEKQSALCRCGQSKNIPFCDGKHQGSFENCARAKNVL